MKPQLLLIEDDVRLGALVKEYLEAAGYEVTHVLTGRAGLSLLAQADLKHELVVLDLMLPDMDGLDVCRELRLSSTVPVIMLTARGDAMDRIVGLELGADDYLPKPFEPRELLARIRAILRRGAQASVATSAAAAASDVLRFGRLEIDRAARQVRLAGAVCDLTAYQFDVLLVLAERAGRVLSREWLMDALKSEAIEAFDRSIDVHISRIRAAIEDDAKQPKRILTLRGAGYVFVKEQD